MRKIALLGIIAAAGTAASAYGQPTYELRSRFAQPHGASPSPVTTLTITATGTFLFTLQGGIFNAQNYPNQNRPHQPPHNPTQAGIEGSGQNTGLIQMLGGIVATGGTGTGYSFGVTGRVAPFNFGAGQGTPGPNGISGIDAPRGSEDVVWPFSDPLEPSPLPVARGVDSFANVHRFSLTVTSLALQTLTLNFSGTGRGGNGWGIISRTVPADGENGVTTFVPNPLHSVPVASTALAITIVPAPGAIALLGMGGLLAARRRRA